tara:strand:- start:575 stop:808 length:234 start_codon:yes stop_codon:yes gene_type:complete
MKNVVSIKLSNGKNSTNLIQSLKNIRKINNSLSKMIEGTNVYKARLNKLMEACTLFHEKYGISPDVKKISSMEKALN